MNNQDLPACPIFDELTHDEQQELRGRMEIDVVPADRDILVESQQIRGLWIIRRGQCQVIKTMPDGSSHALAELGAGAVFGEMSFVRPAPNSATVRTLSEVEVWSLTIAQYELLEQTAPRIAQKITRAISIILAERLGRMDDWISRLLGRNGTATRQEWAEFRAKLYTNWDF